MPLSLTHCTECLLTLISRRGAPSRPATDHYLGNGRRQGGGGGGGGGRRVTLPGVDEAGEQGKATGVPSPPREVPWACLSLTLTEESLS